MLFSFLLQCLLLIVFHMKSKMLISNNKTLFRFTKQNIQLLNPPFSRKIFFTRGSYLVSTCSKAHLLQFSPADSHFIGSTAASLFDPLNGFHAFLRSEIFSWAIDWICSIWFRFFNSLEWLLKPEYFFVFLLEFRFIVFEVCKAVDTALLDFYKFI